MMQQCGWAWYKLLCPDLIWRSSLRVNARSTRSLRYSSEETYVPRYKTYIVFYRQESCAIAKMTAQCALYMVRLTNIFISLHYLFLNLVVVVVVVVVIAPNSIVTGALSHTPLGTWADPDGGHRGHVPPPNQWLADTDRWSYRVGFVSLAGYIPKCIKTCMKSHKIACVMSKIISGRGSTPDPTGGAYTTLPQSTGEGINFLPIQTSSPQRLRRIASSSLATQVQCAPPKTIFWIRPWFSDFEEERVVHAITACLCANSSRVLR